MNFYYLWGSNTKIMKKILSVALALALSLSVSVILRAGDNVPFPKYAGQDAAYSFDVPALTPAPKGYKPQFIEHYGRHGSRYAYATYFYTELRDALARAKESGTLTPRGEQLYIDYYSHIDHYMLNLGNLSEVGWRQQQRIARTMFESFPQVFKAKDAKAYACSSSSMRSTMSMAGFCTGLQGAYPRLDVYAEQNVAVLNATNPRDRKNRFYVSRVVDPWPFKEDTASFQNRILDSRVIAERLFKDVDGALAGEEVGLFIRNMYVLALGMNSLKPEHRTDFSNIFTTQDLQLLDRAQNYSAGCEWWAYDAKVVSVPLDIIEDADAHIASGAHGLKARFGHDHVFLPVLRLMGVNQYVGEPTTPDEFYKIFDVTDTPMACNFQMIFYTSSKPGKPVLVKILLNGVEAKFNAEPVEGPYYRWDDVKKSILVRLEKYPTK